MGLPRSVTARVRPSTVVRTSECTRVGRRPMSRLTPKMRTESERVASAICEKSHVPLKKSREDHFQREPHFILEGASC